MKILSFLAFLVPSLVLAVTPITGLKLQSNADGATYAFTNLSDVVLTNGVKLSTVSGSSTNATTNIVIQGQTGNVNVTNAGSQAFLTVTNLATSNALVIVSNQLLATSNALAAADATALATNLTRGTTWGGSAVGSGTNIILGASSVASSNIVDGAITNDDIGANAAIVMTKVAGLAALSNVVTAATGNVATVTANLAGTSNKLDTATNTVAGLVTNVAARLASSETNTAAWATNYALRNASSSAISNAVLKTGDTMSGALNMGGANITNVGVVYVTNRFVNTLNTVPFDNGAFAIGGQANDAQATYSTIAGGNANTAGGNYSFIGGGINNSAGGLQSSSLGGSRNSAGGIGSATLGGYSNKASGSFSVSAGLEAWATNGGSFVFSDFTDAIYGSHGSNSFNARFSGGFWFGEQLAFDGSGKLHSGVATNTGSDGQVMTRRGTNVSWESVSETSTFANVIVRGGQLNAQTLTNINAASITGTLPATVYGSFPFTGAVVSVQTGPSNYAGTVSLTLDGALSTNYTGTGVQWSVAFSNATQIRGVNVSTNPATSTCIYIKQAGAGAWTPYPLSGDVSMTGTGAVTVATSATLQGYSAGSFILNTAFQAVRTNFVSLYYGAPTSNSMPATQGDAYFNGTNVWIYKANGGGSGTNWFKIAGSWGVP